MDSQPTTTTPETTTQKPAAPAAPMAPVKGKRGRKPKQPKAEAKPRKPREVHVRSEERDATTADGVVVRSTVYVAEIGGVTMAHASRRIADRWVAEQRKQLTSLRALLRASARFINAFDACDCSRQNPILRQALDEVRGRLDARFRVVENKTTTEPSHDADMDKTADIDREVWEADIEKALGKGGRS